MRQLDAAQLRATVAQLCVTANTHLPPDIEAALHTARDNERDELPRGILQTLCDNAVAARDTGLPICQDTGLTVIYVDWGQDVLLTGGDFTQAITHGVADATQSGYLRASVVADPLRRTNTGDNTPPVIHQRFVPGDTVTVTVAPKGFGSENMSALRFLPPHTTPEGIIEAVVQCVRDAGANPCPPVIVGVGLGGTAETCCRNAKRALLRAVGSTHPDPFYADLEVCTLNALQGTGIGPQGMGGHTTALAVFYAPAPTHIAGLPLAVNIGCHATRHASATI